MKTIFLVRHAKSSWKDVGLSDFDRPLNKRGKRDAPFMAKHVAKMEEKPDLIISSPAIRTRSTAIIFAGELGYKESDINYDKNIYLADTDTLTNALKSADNKLNRVMLVAHNPGLTDLVDFLSGEDIDNVPTCGVVKLSYNSTDWSSLSKNSCELIMFDYPKKYLI